MDILAKIGALLQGKKAYAVMIGGILLAIGGYLTGAVTLAQMIGAIMASLGLGGLRSAVGKATPPK